MCYALCDVYYVIHSDINTIIIIDHITVMNTIMYSLLYETKQMFDLIKML